MTQNGRGENMCNNSLAMLDICSQVNKITNSVDGLKEEMSSQCGQDITDEKLRVIEDELKELKEMISVALAE